MTAAATSTAVDEILATAAAFTNIEDVVVSGPAHKKAHWTLCEKARVVRQAWSTKKFIEPKDEEEKTKDVDAMD